LAFIGPLRDTAEIQKLTGRVHKLAKDLIKELEGDKQEFRKCV